MGGETAVDQTHAAFAALEGARAARTAPEASEAAVLAALALAPDDVDVRVAAYKYYFYGHRLAEALPHAAWCIAAGARALGLPEDWRALAPGSVVCAGYDPARRFLVQSLVAWGWCSARIGDRDAALAALAKAAEIDPTDTFAAARIAEVVARGDDLEPED